MCARPAKFREWVTFLGLHRRCERFTASKGYCGYSCKVNSFVCAGLPHNHWQKSYIARGATFKMTCDDVDKIERCIKLLLGPQSSDVTLGPCISFTPLKALHSPSVVI
jgi:hypothetical protein